ncbi:MULTISPECIES: GNAT family N-acetyltransferase [unclassified Ectothiorhodospira]|uniref:GNAT family N-acetyltransferase n=1 Tax=unclassified Ectothiorhodospira TaxID=2684909 RepID=UPI001EE812FC|nr:MULTISPECIES: N-acetyltransferase [unclassified Ectothiorhodospira]MCG5517162.1 N-acetyltransferase [Ectothiorhodospira sp. 9100]MCG5520045.1 N-acetyltransferase [Ectothiorhodospira sp. 9905]
MEFSKKFKGREQNIIDLFHAAFAHAEGAEEGALIGNLVRHQMTDTTEPDLHVFLAKMDRAIVGGAIFSRLTYDQDDRCVFILAPVAVASERQGQGIGQKLLARGLEALRNAGVDVVLTYGDPNYYSRVGFKPISESLAPAPFTLKQPEGWLGQSLAGGEMAPLKGAPHCIPALNDPVFW